MNGFVVRFAISALGLWAASHLVSGVVIDDGWTLVIAALLLGLVNALVRPIAIVLTLPLTLLTLGLFILVVNAAMFALVAAMLAGFHLSGFGAALLGALVVSVTSWLASAFIGPKGRYEMIVVRRRL
jgi:putative membrane protein